MRALFDITEVVKQYQIEGTETNKLRHRIFQELSINCHGNSQVLTLIGTIVENMVNKGHPPVDCVAFALVQGMTIGVLLENERAARERKPI